MHLYHQCQFIPSAEVPSLCSLLMIFCCTKLDWSSCKTDRQTLDVCGGGKPVTPRGMVPFCLCFFQISTLNWKSGKFPSSRLELIILKQHKLNGEVCCHLCGYCPTPLRTFSLFNTVLQDSHAVSIAPESHRLQWGSVNRGGSALNDLNPNPLLW